MNNKIKYIMLSMIIFGFITNLFSQNSALTIKVGVYDNYPKAYVDDDNNVAGIFPEILELIGKDENWAIEYIHGTWDEGLNRLENAEIDIMVSVSFSEAREKIFDFTEESVVITWGCLYTTNRLMVNSILDLEGKKVAVVKNSILTNGEDGIYSLVERFGVNCSFVEVDDYHQVFDLIQKREVDAGVTNRQFGFAFRDQYQVKESSYIFYPTQLKYAFTKNSDLSKLLIPIIDDKLSSLKQDMDSIYYSILTKYNLYPKKCIPKWLNNLIIVLIGLILFFFIVFLILKLQIKQQTKILEHTNADLKAEIIDHQKTYEKLMLSRETYRSFVENIPGLVYMYDIDADGSRTPIISTSRNEEFLGKELAAKIIDDYNQFFECIVEEDAKKVEELSAKIEKNGGIFNFEYRLRISKDITKWFRTIGRVRKLEDGKIRWQGVILDIQDRKKVEQELDIYREHLEHLVESRTEDLQHKTEELETANMSLKEADELKSIFLASMSHELRTPLNSIIGFTGILLMGMVGELTEEQRKQLSIVKKSASHLLELINDILDISKVEAGKVELFLEEFEVNEVIAELVKSVEPTAINKGLYLNKKLDDKIIQFSDKRRFKQVILNLLSNAVKFTETGSVTVISNILDNGFLEISIADTGIGIREEDHKKLFEPFQQIDSSLTKKHAGTGLGLHLTQKLLKLLNGQISVKSSVGKGTTFVVTLPINIEEISNEKSSVD